MNNFRFANSFVIFLVSVDKNLSFVLVADDKRFSTNTEYHLCPFSMNIGSSFATFLLAIYPELKVINSSAIISKMNEFSYNALTSVISW